MRRYWLALLLVVPLPAAAFLAQAGFYSSSDGMIHLYRLFELDRAVSAGIPYPRWFPLSGYGYGLPVLNYYPPLQYYAAEMFRLLGAGYIESTKLVVAASFLIAAVSAFLFARGLVGDAPAMVAGVAYAYSPYLLSDAYVRGNFPELLAMAVLPLGLLRFRRLFRLAGDRGAAADQHLVEARPPGPPQRSRFGRLTAGLRTTSTSRVFAAGLVFAVIITMHHLTAMLFGAALLAYAAYLALAYRDSWGLRASAAAVLLALGLSAFYWLPSIAELNLVYVGPASVARFIVSRLVTLQDLMAPALVYTYVPQSDALKHVAGLPQVAVALIAGMASALSLLRFMSAKRVGRGSGSGEARDPKSAWSVQALSLDAQTLDERVTATFALVVVLASLAMTLSITAPLWYAVPVLRFMQFPWRFEILTSFGFAFLLSVAAGWLGNAFARYHLTATVYTFACLALIGLGIANLPERAFPLSDSQVNLLRSADPSYVVAQMGWGWTREFVPATGPESDSVYEPVERTLEPAAISTALRALQVENDGLVSKTFRVSTAQPFTVALHTFYYPGWQAFVDGAAAATAPLGPLGLVSTVAPPGDHVIQFDFQDTPLRSAADWVSLLVFAGFAAWLVIAKPRAAVITLGAVAVVVALWLLHAHAASPGLDSSGPPVAISANLDDHAMLVGYAADRTRYHPGDTAHVTLYWLALQEMDTNFQAYVHVSDRNGGLLAQHDGAPDQGLTPTTRWLVGEVVVDRHAVSLGTAAPGAYRLDAGMYLPVGNGYEDLGQPIDLGTLEVVR